MQSNHNNQYKIITIVGICWAFLFLLTACQPKYNLNSLQTSPELEVMRIGRGSISGVAYAPDGNT
ncbi:MAG: hypothetical protein AAF639_17500, partial [Chloroflexota bacterium]